MLNIAVFASGGGSNLQAIIDACRSGRIDVQVCAVISNNANAFALRRAKEAGIPAYCLTEEAAILSVLRKHETDLIFLAGYLKKIGHSILNAYDIYNIHPSLLPKYGGKGMYGIHVHKAVLAAGETETGITIHKVDVEYDTGQIMAQRVIEVLPSDTPEVLSTRVLEQEHVFIVEFLKNIPSTIVNNPNFC